MATTYLLSRIRSTFFPLYLVQSQDELPLSVLSISLLVFSIWTPLWRLPRRLPKPLTLAAAGALIVGFLGYGTHVLMGNFPLSVDERMVVFDMAVYDRLQLAAPLVSKWRPYANALVPGFLFNRNTPTGLISSYLPMNAILRLAFSKLADPALFNPLLALVSGAALLDLARRLFGQDTAACWVVLLVYALSAQMLVNAMTVYSMTGHMALNLIWLAAFMRRGRLGHSVAIVTGFVATGLHQIAFHPFFVAPFLLWRLRHREWQLVLLYGAAYIAIILWWACYPLIVGHEVASATQQPANASLALRISRLFAQQRGPAIINTVLNVLRFIAWQNLALLPLVSGATAVALRDRGLPAVLLLGISLWVAFVTIVMPSQGFGWGYRYLHPYLGSFALLAGYGYQELRAEIGRRAEGLVLALSGITAFVTIPLLFVAAHRFIEPYLALERLVAIQRAPMVLIDTYRPRTTDGRWGGNAIVTVRNRPDLGNRPLRFSSEEMNSELVEGLCGRGKVTLITRTDEARVGFEPNALATDPLFARLIRSAQEKWPDCFVPAAESESR